MMAAGCGLRGFEEGLASCRGAAAKECLCDMEGLTGGEMLDFSAR